MVEGERLILAGDVVAAARPEDERHPAVLARREDAWYRHRLRYQQEALHTQAHVAISPSRDGGVLSQGSSDGGRHLRDLTNLDLEPEHESVIDDKGFLDGQLSVGGDLLRPERQRQSAGGLPVAGVEVTLGELTRVDGAGVDAGHRTRLQGTVAAPVAAAGSLTVGAALASQLPVLLVEVVVARAVQRHQ